MASINYKTLLNHLKTTLANVGEPDFRNGDFFDAPVIRDSEREATINYSLQSDTPVDFGGQLTESIGIHDKGDEAYQGLFDELQKDDVIGSKVGNESVKKATTNLLNFLRHHPDKSDAHLNARIRELVSYLRDRVQQWTAFVAIDNFVLKDIPKLHVGRVTYYPKGSLNQSLKEQVWQVVDAFTNTDDEKLLIKDRYEKDLDENFGSADVIASIDIDAEQSAVSVIADRHIELSLDLLRCYTPLLHSAYDRAHIGLQGSLVIGQRACLALTPDCSRFTFKQWVDGKLIPYTISPTDLEYLKSKCSFNVLSDIIAKPESNRTSFEDNLAGAVRWIGKGVNASETPERVLNYAIALERMLTEKPSTKNQELGSITDRISRRMAFLLSQDLSKRLEIYQRMRDLYNLRSEVAHAGRTDILQKDVRALEMGAVRVLMKMAEHSGEWKNLRDFSAWVRNQEFS